MLEMECRYVGFHVMYTSNITRGVVKNYYYDLIIVIVIIYFLKTDYSSNVSFSV
jgi:hypothetical protein